MAGEGGEGDVTIAIATAIAANAAAAVAIVAVTTALSVNLKTATNLDCDVYYELRFNKFKYILKNKTPYKMYKKRGSKIQQRMQQLNSATFQAMTSEEVNAFVSNPEVVKCLDGLSADGYVVIMNGEQCYNDHELRIIEKMTACIAGVIYAEQMKAEEIQNFGVEAETEIFDWQITTSMKGLLSCRDQFPEMVEFFVQEGKTIYLKSSTYFIFEERIMYKTDQITYGGYYQIEVPGMPLIRGINASPRDAA